MAQAGATEIMIEPSGPDIARELETYISAVTAHELAGVRQ
jgi:hypothetical protein